MGFIAFWTCEINLSYLQLEGLRPVSEVINYFHAQLSSIETAHQN